MRTKAGALLLIGVFSFLILNTRADQTPAPWVVRWLSWSPEQRFIFVEGFQLGYERGVSEACHTADTLFDLDKPIYDLDQIVYARCYRHTKSYSKGSDVYANVITQFYAKHAKYRNIPITYMMMLLIDSGYQTADEIYQAAEKREIQVDFTWKPKEPQ